MPGPAAASCCAAAQLCTAASSGQAWCAAVVELSCLRPPLVERSTSSWPTPVPKVALPAAQNFPLTTIPPFTAHGAPVLGLPLCLQHAVKSELPQRHTAGILGQPGRFPTACGTVSLGRLLWLLCPACWCNPPVALPAHVPPQHMLFNLCAAPHVLSMHKGMACPPLQCACRACHVVQRAELAWKQPVVHAAAGVGRARCLSHPVVIVSPAAAGVPLGGACSHAGLTGVYIAVATGR